ncbi:maleylacetoacetate isomerase [Shewanella oneidensis MR-1]|uniref:Maleylacetoacetate isomerase MaiA n=1 Tax=Shewanella oneidensis (strain ATCC 700550 / JCM 31522 / CIP 106686 / LMG 19005 / NCIMB 14063 / MR-1) TaxID=211586 RepID=Q8EGD3_SHEON|nr:maleylacetoacetate isomerase [Shewanella oneidensis]AAN54726.1 maleylacetoacetate isomerase MaiA [Shewanella oneidensis MR-1]MDX5996529.1 maleylacetoacetate isomerase [Shewanella oneidensis]MEE2027269.1 Maleylpyruvate isomerase [Shewanella oneidensis]QKG96366.1 maleylacetoacetate isomerase [Shewanella oneidensis MR-1]
MILYGYWRSSAAYRVRIALNLKGVSAEQLSVHLVRDGGEQHKADYIALNPQELVPTLVVDDEQDGDALTQSLAIIEYLDELYPKTPLLPASALERAHVRAMALTIACEIHPLNNLRVLQYLTQKLTVNEEAKSAWYHHWVATGFTALETQLVRHSGRYCFGDKVTIADLCLVPQVYNAQRFNVDLTPYPNIMRVWAECNQLPAFADAAPERQADAV